MGVLPDSLIKEISSELRSQAEKGETFVFGTAKIENGQTMVLFDGADDYTPASSTVEVSDGNRVMVMIKNHEAVITSNISAPTATLYGIRAKYAELGGFISTAERTGTGNPDFTCQTKTSQQGGHAYPISLYSQASGGGYDYEVGMKGDAYGSSPHTNVAFYVKRIASGSTWAPANVENIFYINNSGKLVAQNAVIKGEVEATKFKAVWTGSTISAIELKAEMTAGGLDVTSDYTTLGHFHLRLSPENTTWIKSTNMLANSSHVRINSSGIYIGTTNSGGEEIQLKADNGRIVTSGEIQSTSNIKCSSGDGAPSTNIHANMVDVYAEGNNGERTGRFTASAAGNIGLYDVDNANYIIYSDPDLIVHSNHKFYCQGQADTTERMPIGSSNVSNQKVGWLGCTATATLSIRGQWNANSWATKTVAVSSSDTRLKKDISDTKVDALDVISRIPMREFTWKEDDVFQPLGVIADELEKIDPMFVVGGGEDENGDPIYKSINTLYLLAYCVKAIQELKGDHDDGR